jgi:hypothetical protein
MRDPTLPHQIVLNFVTVDDRNGYIGVSCNCRRTGKGGADYVPFEARLRWEPADVLAVYRAHLAEEGAA